QARLAQLVGDERTDELEKALARVETFHAEAQKRFPREPLRTSLAGALFEVGRGLYNAGRIEGAVKMLERSLAIEPRPEVYERGATYPELLAFLVPRGERGEALDAYHRALGRGAISEYLKVYCSLWIINLDRRSGQPEDPLAAQFLASVNGARWYHELTRWASG